VLVLSQQSVTFRLAANADLLLRGDPREKERLISSLQAQVAGYRGQRAGVVLTFGASRNPDEGKALARAANALLNDARISDIFGNAVKREYIELSVNKKRGEIDLEVFFFAPGT
jgi:hypothetical protein